MSIRHDYKSAATGQRRQRARRYGLLVMTLVLIGLFGGLLAYIKGDRTQAAPATAAAVTPSARAQPPTPTQPPAPVALAAPPKPVVAPLAEPEPVKPKYDFYTELPKRKIAIQRENIKPGNAPQSASARIPPADNPLHKPATPRGNPKNPTPTMAAASGAKPDSKTTNSKTTNSESANSKTTTSKTTNSKTANSKTANSTSTSTSSRPATVKTANSEPANSKSTSTNSKSTPTISKPTTAKPTPAAPTPPTTPTRTAQPLRPLANNSSKIVVKTE